ncbi:hypothetical protein GGP41_004524 [Bipolaris sorokiniana]|uniref:C2H2-type domain-containing protein n=1 Tax=Cochliobolus sativus TaxID=45130 RepID=A0A8H5ZAA3_COCSA|nr:hypothetical protein GGP41_004524 [Bipolaris sorokiniana]
MVPFPVDVSLPDSLKDLPFQKDIVVRPEADGKYQCGRCPKRFLCHEPYQYHATKHGDTIEHIYIESKQLKSYVKAFHGVCCRRSTHYVRVTISESLGYNSEIRRIDEEHELTFEEFLEKDFNATKPYKETLESMVELQRQCCRSTHDTTVSGPKKLFNWVRSCFACIPTPRRSWSSRWTPDKRPTSLYSSTKTITASNGQDTIADDPTSTASWPSTPDTRLASLYPSIEATDVKNGQDLVANDPTSIAKTVLPEKLSGIIAVHAFYSTSNGGRGHKALVATQSDTVMLLQRVDLDVFLSHGRIMNQLQNIVGGQAFKELLEFQEKRMDILEPVYCGILPDDLPIGVGEELSLEECSPTLFAHVNNCIHI